MTLGIPIIEKHKQGWIVKKREKKESPVESESDSLNSQKAKRILKKVWGQWNTPGPGKINIFLTNRPTHPPDLYVSKKSDEKS